MRASFARKCATRGDAAGLRDSAGIGVVTSYAMRNRHLRTNQMAGLFLPIVSTTMSANAWLAHGRARGELKLGLLPFLLEHAMLPGELRDVFLFDESLRSCVSAAAGTHHCIGGLLMSEDGNSYELTTLLRIEEFKTDSDCTWARLSCIGRCLISGMRRNTRHGYRVAVVSPCSDSGGAAAPVDNLRAVHGKVASQRRQLKQALLGKSKFDSGTWESVGRADLGMVGREVNLGRSSVDSRERIYVGADKGRAPFGVYESYESFEESGVLCEHVYLGQPWERPNALGCCYFDARDLGELDDEENGADLSDLLATRQTALVGEEPHSGRGLLDAVGNVWGVAREEEAQIQLLSFAATATLGPLDRVRALMMTDTTQRLDFAQEKLREQQSLLADLLLV